MKNILIVVDHFYPSFKAGGPALSTYRICQALKKRANITVFTSAKDGDESELVVKLSDPDYDIVYSKDFSFRTLISLVRQGNFQFIYCNSFFSVLTIKFLLVSIFCSSRKIRCVVAPRGELSGGAMSIKPVKKILYLRVFQVIFFFKNNWTIHFTGAYERASSLARFRSSDVAMADNFPAVADIGSNFCGRHVGRSHAAIYFGRISPKKRTLETIQIFSRLEKKNTAARLEIFGPASDVHYSAACFDALGQTGSVFYQGPVPRQRGHAVLSGFQFFILLSADENYGHSVVEAMLAGCVPIISDRMPWADVEDFGCGFVIPVDMEFEEVVNKVNRALGLSYEELVMMRKRLRIYLAHRINIEKIRAQYYEMFEIV